MFRVAEDKKYKRFNTRPVSCCDKCGCKGGKRVSMLPSRGQGVLDMFPADALHIQASDLQETYPATCTYFGTST
jgi:hypothetical protein